MHVCNSVKYWAAANVNQTSMLGVEEEVEITHEMIPENPFAAYHIPTLAGCSSLFHHVLVMSTKPGLRQDSKTPRKKRAAARELNDLAELMHIRSMPA